MPDCQIFGLHRPELARFVGTRSPGRKSGGAPAKFPHRPKTDRNEMAVQGRDLIPVATPNRMCTNVAGAGARPQQSDVQQYMLCLLRLSGSQCTANRERRKSQPMVFRPPRRIHVEAPCAYDLGRFAVYYGDVFLEKEAFPKKRPNLSSRASQL
jgi:hypothetical protein